MTREGKCRRDEAEKRMVEEGEKRGGQRKWYRGKSKERKLGIE